MAENPADPAGAGRVNSLVTFRIRYSETDQMGTYYNSRPLEWFELGRTELLRKMGFPYARMESEGVFLPVIEAHLEYHGRARYDDPLKMFTTATMVGRARIRFDVQILHAETNAELVRGYTIHAFTDAAGKPVRPPAGLVAALREDSK